MRHSEHHYFNQVIYMITCKPPINGDLHYIVRFKRVFMALMKRQLHNKIQLFENFPLNSFYCMPFEAHFEQNMS